MASSGEPVLVAAAALPAGPRSALIIATSRYDDPGLSQLRGPVKDADDLAEVLADPVIGGFTVTTLTDETSWQIQRAVAKFLAGRALDETVLVYLSCHGLKIGDRLYFAAANTERDLPQATGVPSAFVLEELDRCRARRQVLILDCCFSGGFAGVKDGGNLDLESVLTSKGRGRWVLTGSRAGEYSYEGKPAGSELTGSVFTTGLVAGLRSGAAAAQRTGLITVHEAYKSAYQYVLDTQPRQTPEFWVSGGEGDIVLARGKTRTVFPAPLPEALRAALDSKHPGIRVGAVTDIAEWLTDLDLARRVAARRALEDTASRDIDQVATAARTALAAAAAAEEATPAAAQSLRLVRNQAYGMAPVSEPDPVVPAGDTDPGPLSPTSLDWCQRLLQHAERTAEQVQDSGEQACLLAKVAGAAAKLPNGRYETLVTRAAMAASQAVTPISRATALTAIAALWLGTNKTQGEQLLREAEMAARRAAPRRMMALVQRKEADKRSDEVAGAMRAIATEVAIASPEKARELAQSIESAGFRDAALSDIAKTLADAMPDKAVAIAGAIGQPATRAAALRAIACQVATSNPARAAEMLGGIQGNDERDQVRQAIAIAFAPADAGRAVLVAESIDDEMTRFDALTSTATLVAAAGHVAEAQLIASRITDEGPRAAALAMVGAVISRADSAEGKKIIDGALGVALGMDATKHSAKARKVTALVSVALAMMAASSAGFPDVVKAAEDLARSMKAEYNYFGETGDRKDAQRYSVALTEVGSAIAVTDLKRAKQMIEEGTKAYPGFGVPRAIEERVTYAIRVIAPSDPDRAELMALRLLSSSGTDPQTAALRELAIEQARVSPERAERIASNIADLPEQVRTLLQIAAIHAPAGNSPGGGPEGFSASLELWT